MVPPDGYVVASEISSAWICGVAPGSWSHAAEARNVYEASTLDPASGVGPSVNPIDRRGMLARCSRKSIGKSTTIDPPVNVREVDGSASRVIACGSGSIPKEIGVVPVT